MLAYPGIPEPQATIPSHQETLVVLKEAVEVLARQRGDQQESAVRMKELTAAVAELNVRLSTLIPDAPQDGNMYVRQDGAWVILPP